METILSWTCSHLGRRAEILHTLLIVCSVLLISTGCGQTQPGTTFQQPNQHRYFIEVDRPGSVYSILSNPQIGGAYVKLQEIDVFHQAIGDTVSAWVEHFNGRNSISSEAYSSDLLIACHRELLPTSIQQIHVLPESRGEVYVYMMRGGVLVVSNNTIPYYDVLLISDDIRRTN